MTEARADLPGHGPVCGMAVKPDSPQRKRPRLKRLLQPGKYTRPMHPEVRRIGPGACPKCGMALEPATPAAEAEDNPELAGFRRCFW